MVRVFYQDAFIETLNSGAILCMTVGLKLRERKNQKYSTNYLMRSLSPYKLYFKPLIGSHSELVQIAPMTFAWRGMNISLICFTKNDKGKNVMMIGESIMNKRPTFGQCSKELLLL